MPGFDITFPFRVALGLGAVIIHKFLKTNKKLYWTAYAYVWDFWLNVDNFLSKQLKEDEVIPPGKPGHLGDWSRFVYLPPTKNDARSPCPALNALANHGILPRDGRDISFVEISKAIQTAYNLSGSLCLNVPMTIAGLWEKDYFHDRVDLSDFNAHNVIEHDASILRHDAAFQPDQGAPSVDLIEDLLSRATGTANINGRRTRILTIEDVAAFTRQRRIEGQANNGQYTLKMIHKLFSANNNAILQKTFGGRVDDLRTFLIEEKLPQGWQPRVLAKNGLTIASLNATTFKFFSLQDPLPFVGVGFGEQQSAQGSSSNRNGRLWNHENDHED